MADFRCVGLDIRTMGRGQRHSADVSIWHQDTRLYKCAKEELLIKENMFQLLQPDSSAELEALAELTTSASALVSLEIPERVLQSYPHSELISPGLKDVVSEFNWSLLGFDVCDLDAFFSFLDMPPYSNNIRSIFKENEKIEALLEAQAANFAAPDHAPFVTVRLNLHLK